MLGKGLNPSNPYLFLNTVMVMDVWPVYQLRRTLDINRILSFKDGPRCGKEMKRV